MGCFGCFAPEADEGDGDHKPSKPDDSSGPVSISIRQFVRFGRVSWLGLLTGFCWETGADARRKVAPDVANGYAHSFTFKDLLVATGYFNEANFIGEGGFGKVYKGKINGQVS
jgi:hypothetical protein